MASHSLLTLSNTTPTRITPNGTHSGMDITLQNVNSTGYVFIGVDENVSSTNFGYKIFPSHAISFELAGYDALYAIAETDQLQLAVISIDLETQE
jgi:hypothetical protein